MCERSEHRSDLSIVCERSEYTYSLSIVCERSEYTYSLSNLCERSEYTYSLSNRTYRISISPTVRTDEKYPQPYVQNINISNMYVQTMNLQPELASLAHARSHTIDLPRVYSLRSHTLRSSL